MSDRLADYGLSVHQTKLPPIEEAAEEAIAAYRNLDMLTDAGRARETFAHKLVELNSALHYDHKDEAAMDLVMVPKIGEISLRQLISHYRSLFKSQVRSSDFSRVKITSTLERDAEQFAQDQVEAVEAQAILLGSPCVRDGGLYGTDQSVEAQRSRLIDSREQAERRGDSTRPIGLSIAGYIMRNTMLLERGKSIMDQYSITTFPDLETSAPMDYTGEYFWTASSFQGPTTDRHSDALHLLELKKQPGDWQRPDAGFRMALVAGNS
jgi:hypothetical protein